MFCSKHDIPQVGCLNCHTAASAMRPTVFAELAAAELKSGTECCRNCDYIFYEAAEHCPQCGAPNPLYPEVALTVPAALPLVLEGEFVDLDVLALREPRPV
ncbi:MAG: hypothetical protein AB1430_10085 [Pseudomonadota bacterium]